MIRKSTPKCIVILLCRLTSSYAKHPGWIKGIFIRLVDVDLTDVETFKRFDDTFKRVPGEFWKTFKDPWELASIIDCL